jgi:aldose 1-epimerase
MIAIQRFGTLPHGGSVNAYTLRAPNGLSATVLNYGATLQSFRLPNGTDIVLGFDSLEEYLRPHPYFGAVIGRVSNRIGGAHFNIGEKSFRLSENEGENTLHSGPIGFDRVNWDAHIEGDTLCLTHKSPEGHQGYPGEVTAKVRYSLDDEGLRLEMSAQTTKDTPISLTGHSYFNLGDSTVCRHALSFEANYFFQTREDGVNKGKKQPLTDHPFDFRASKTINQSAMDHHFNIPGTGMRKMARLFSPDNAHRLTVLSDLPGLQIYTGYNMKACQGKDGQSYGAFAGIAFEPQFPPNAVNLPHLPSVIVSPDQSWSHTILYRIDSLSQ